MAGEKGPGWVEETLGPLVRGAIHGLKKKRKGREFLLYMVRAMSKCAYATLC
jgi:hypothetical protein